MKILIKDLAVGSCYAGRGGTVMKKISPARAATPRAGGGVRTQAARGGRAVEPVSCPLSHLGIGLGSPEALVEMGTTRKRKR